MPFAWLIFLGLFIISILHNFRQLKNGYKYPRRTILLSALVTVIFFGSLAAMFDLNQKVHTALSQQVPFYRATFDPRSQVWNRPQMGFLAGKIIKLDDDDNLIIKDPRLTTWQIKINPETIISPEVELELDEQIKVIGFIINDNNFRAQEIRLWERPAWPGGQRPIPKRKPINRLPAPNK
ncbi:MAG: hypothetical protein NTX66_04275 [Candidatus Falkowbacteria bacterium]|nr:hypothetical protein [Candidatus Falkowbacteria bacterium]